MRISTRKAGESFAAARLFRPLADLASARTDQIMVLDGTGIASVGPSLRRRFRQARGSSIFRVSLSDARLNRFPSVPDRPLQHLSVFRINNLRAVAV